MVRAHGLVAVLAASVVLGACGNPPRSLLPLYDPERPVTDDRLPGTWEDTDDDDDFCMTIHPADARGDYRILVVDSDSSEVEDTVLIDTHLVWLGEHLFLDLELPRAEPGSDDLFLVPGHLFAKIHLEADSLGMAFMDDDRWLRNLMRGPDGELIPGPHPELAGAVLVGRRPRAQGMAAAGASEWADEGIVLTAGTPELQAFVLAHVHEAFSEPAWLVRREGPCPVGAS